MTVSIMVVEDESLVALDIVERLRSLVYEVPCMVSTGQDAIRKAEELKPALVLMDIGLRGHMNGIEAAIRIRAQFGIPVVFLTAYQDDNTSQIAATAKPYGYISKPFDDTALQKAVEAALRSAGKEPESIK